MTELIGLETEFPEFFDANSPTQRVGSDLNQKFKQIAHKYQMLSLSDTYSEEEVQEFDQRVRKLTNENFEYVCELKFDGVSISINYENGLLVRAVTRADGAEALCRIKEVGSITIAQKPETATQPDMPESAIASG